MNALLVASVAAIIAALNAGSPPAPKANPCANPVSSNIEEQCQHLNRHWDSLDEWQEQRRLEREIEWRIVEEAVIEEIDPQPELFDEE